MKQVKDGTDLTRTLGTLLDKQIKSADKSNKIIKNRARVINDLRKSTKGVSNIRSAFTNQVNILRTQNQIAKARNKTGQFQKGYNNSVVEGLNTDLKALEANKEKISLDGIRQEATAGINKTMLAGVGIITASSCRYNKIWSKTR